MEAHIAAEGLARGAGGASIDAGGGYGIDEMAVGAFIAALDSGPAFFFGIDHAFMLPEFEKWRIPPIAFEFNCQTAALPCR